MGSSFNFNKNSNIKTVLVSPLDWGLGHATRCIPIIKELLDLGCTVLIAANGNALELLKDEFPELISYNIPGYNIRYSKNGRGLKLRLLIQLPHIIRTVIRENRWLKSFVKQYKVDVVISDNRIGLFNRDTISVYITHQLTIKTGNQLTEKLFKYIHYRVIKNFDHCWVPDSQFEGLAGDLSHPDKLLPNTLYLGPISRFVYRDAPAEYEILCIISGPEPQRTILENIFASKSFDFTGKMLLVRGISNGGNLETGVNCAVRNLVSSEELNRLISGSGLVVSRSGYTSVMDLAKLKKPAVLIPTPGQTEQLYLCDYLMKKRMFFCIPQDEFSSIDSLLYSFKSFNTIVPPYDWDYYKSVIKDFINSLS